MATISINDLNVEPAAQPEFDTTEAVKGGKGEVYLTYKLENTLISSYS